MHDYYFLSGSLYASGRSQGMARIVVYREQDLASNLHFFEDYEDVLFILLFLLQGQKRYCGQAGSCSFTS